MIAIISPLGVTVDQASTLATALETVAAYRANGFAVHLNGDAPSAEWSPVRWLDRIDIPDFDRLATITASPLRHAA